jgi:outer membrane protein assembly factor BamB
LRVGPAFDSRGQVCYQLGENSNLFALATSTLKCQEVLYLGHEPESVHVPPMVVSPYVFVVEDQGVHDSLLHILIADESGTNIRQAQEPILLAGHVLAPLETSGRTLVAATDRGGVYSFEINPPDPGPPLVKVAEKPADDREPLVRYPLLKDTQLWIAGNGITKYDVLASRGKLEPRSTKDEGDVFVEQPTLIGKVLIHARRHGNQPDVVVAAVSADDGTRYWETSVSAPPAGAPLSDAATGRFWLFNRVGSMFTLSADDLLKSGVQDAVEAPSDISAAFSGTVTASLLTDGGAAFSSAAVGARALVAGKTGPQRWLPLPDALGAPAVAFQGGLLAPGKRGQVRVIDPATGGDRLQPFQPRLGRGPEYRWSTPLIISDDELLLADGESMLYRLGVAEKPEPHLVALAEAKLEGPISAPLAVAGTTAYAVNGENALLAFSLGEGGAKTLTRGKSWPLPAPVTWGPFAAGSRVLLATLDNHLLALDERQEMAWQIEWKHGSLSGTPLVVDDALLLQTKTGQLCKLAAASGDQKSIVELGEPLAAGPVAMGDRLLLAAKSGTLLVVAKP